MARLVANSPRADKVAVRVYRYAHLQKQCDFGNVLGVVPKGRNFSSSWASHGAEIPLVFDNSVFPDPLNASAAAPPVHCNWTSEDRRLVEQMQSYWGSLARTGVPVDATSAALVWPVFGREEELSLVLTSPKSRIAAKVKAADCLIWEEPKP